MELANGFCQTEAVLIPRDWEVKRIGDIGHVVRGGSPRPAGDPRYFDGDFIPWLTVAALTRLPESQTEVTETFSFLTEEGAKRSRRLSPDTVIIANSGATLGVAKRLKIECCANDGIAAIVGHQEGDKDYIVQYINSQTEVLREVVATGNGQPNLNTSLIREICLPFPPLREQRAIAAALSDVDALVAALDALIAKKRAVKTAAMQDLLTGRQRLPGFSGAWGTKTLDEIGDVESAGANKKSVSGEVDVRLVNYMDVYNRNFIRSDDLHHQVTAPPAQAARCAVQKGDVFFTPSSEVSDDIGHSAVAMEDIPDGAHSYHVMRLRIRDDWDLRFRAYAFKTRRFYEQASMLCAGSGTRYVLSKANFKKLEVLVPLKEEQTAIGEIIYAIDAEIAALEARRDKTTQIKQGMMQELLTGRTRLV